MFASRAVYHDPTVIEIITPYNAGFVELLKAQIPASYRSWDPQIKSWMVAAPYDTTAIRLLLQFFPNAEVDDKPRSGSREHVPAGCGCDADHRALFVCQNAPAPVVRAAYRALAKLSHPDAGGDAERMRAINAAFERLTSGGAA